MSLIRGKKSASRIDFNRYLSEIGGVDIHDDSENDENYVIGIKLPKERKKIPVSKVSRSIANVFGNSTTLQDAQNKIIASFVPDDIIYHLNDYSHRSYEICLLFSDVSGFTDLSEKYNQPGNGGPSRLTQVLNTYIGSMVQEILSHGGDIFKFSGDAFLAFWKVRKSLPMQEAVHEGMDSALIIQKRYGQYATEVGVTLRVKLALSAGKVEIALIGTEKESHYVIAGQPVWDAKNAEKLSSAGEVVCSPSAWQYLNPSEYVHEFKKDNKHCSVMGFGSLWHATGAQRTSGVDDDDQADQATDIIIDTTETRRDLDTDRFMIRPAVHSATRSEVRDGLRRFVLPPVMNAIDNNQPMDHLTEMRQVVIMFINIVPVSMHPSKRLINLTHQCYVTICDIINEFEGGIVNKASLFDKDLMMVVIFGLRGFIKEFQNQTALRAGAEIRKRISQFKDQKSVSVAVTTGMSYCGVVGHTLRREYSVIGMVVNKAARLMVAYPDMVCCDKDTFILSKMESRNFTLLRHKELKGLHAVGPVYAFNEIIRDEDSTRIELCKFPILGCDYLMRHYFDVLLRYTEVYKQVQYKWDPDVIIQNVLIYKGAARQGKTRLLDELFYLTPQKYNSRRINLFPQNQKVPFSAIFLSVGGILGIYPKETAKQRETQIFKLLAKVKVNELLCSLNEVFNVNFEMSNIFFNLPYDKKNEVRIALFKHLILSISSSLWVLIIDNLEYMDEESLMLFINIFESNAFFCTGTLGNRRDISDLAASVLNHPRVVTVKMPKIDNWYHAALACQMLEVSAIPLELEKIIQTHSGGNPGWIESFMLSLIQSGGLNLQTIREREVISQGLVIPPSEQMIRQSTQDILRKLDNIGFGLSRVSFGWEMYNGTFRTSDVEIENREDTTSYGVHFISVVLLPPNFKMEMFITDVGMDLLILMNFDSLNVFEQLICKIGAVLGESFHREILKYVVDNDDEYALASSIKKLFEIKVLYCASGDSASRSSSEHDKLICYCENIKILAPELPSFAYCEYMMFRMPAFRETIHSIMTDRQRKDSHKRAFNFLERETKRCRSCGGGFFLKILGGRLADRLHSRRILSKRAQISYAQCKRRTSKLSAFVHKEIYSQIDNLDEIAWNKFYGDKIKVSGNLWGFVRRKSRQTAQTAVETFPSFDFNNCECSLILMSMYGEMLDHCKGAEMHDIIMDVYVEFAVVCISSGNLIQAMALLTRAAKALDDNYSDMSSEIEWKYNTILGKINSLLGKCYLNLGQIEKAYTKLHEALNNFGYNIPLTKMAVVTSTHFKRMQLRLIVDRASHKIGKLEDYSALFCDIVAECLCSMCEMFISLNIWYIADLAATWALLMAIRSDKDFNTICVAYLSLMDVSTYYGRHEFIWWLEKNVLAMISQKQVTGFVNNDLNVVCRVYYRIFISRLGRCELINAIDMGYKTKNLSVRVQPFSIRLQVLPLLINSLIARIRLSEAAELLEVLRDVAKEDSDNSAMCWYYALCLDMALDTGYAIETYTESTEFYTDECESLLCSRDPDSELAFYSAMWLWCIRISEWEAMSTWERKIRQKFDLNSYQGIANTKSMIKVLEGFISKLALAVQSKDFAEIHRSKQIIKVLKNAIAKSVKRVQCERMRFSMMLAYLKKVKRKDNEAIKLMHKCRDLCIQNQHKSMLMICDHQIQYWKGTLPPKMVDFWTKIFSSNKKAYFRPSVTDVICYTLRLPNY